MSVFPKVADVVVGVDSFGALKIADAAGLALLTVILNKSLIWMIDSIFGGNLLFNVTSLIPLKYTTFLVLQEDEINVIRTNK